MKSLTSLSLAAALMVVAATLTLADTASKNTAQTQAAASHMQISFLHMKLRFKAFQFSR
ncbi:MAG: hypothetical protein WCE69_13060 [Aestuariivirga sp.]|jgi:hypothetical protein